MATKQHSDNFVAQIFCMKTEHLSIQRQQVTCDILQVTCYRRLITFVGHATVPCYKSCLVCNGLVCMCFRRKEILKNPHISISMKRAIRAYTLT